MAGSSRLKPGEKSTITARFDTTGRKGKVIKTVRVMSNDPERPEIILSLKADIREIVLIGPHGTSVFEGGL